MNRFLRKLCHGAIALSFLCAAMMASAETLGPPAFSVSHGLFVAPFTLELSTSVSGVTILYTLDGSEPLAGKGLTYSAPLSITTTTCVRARVFGSGGEHSESATQTYLFPADIVNQQAPEGFPDGIDWHMDPRIAADARYGVMGIQMALRALPSLSIVMDPGQLFGENGVWRAGTVCGDSASLEHSASVELLPFKNFAGFQANGGVRPRGVPSPKRSLDCVFKPEYGPAPLSYPVFESAPWNAETAPQRLYGFVLRGGTGDSWVLGSVPVPAQVTYLRDQWALDSQIAVSGAGGHGTFFHLFLNGLYFGLYNAAESLDSFFASEQWGGQEGEWFVAPGSEGGACAGTAQEGNASYYELMLAMAAAGGLENPDRYQAFGELFDIDAFIEYVLIRRYSGAPDPLDDRGTGLQPTVPAGEFRWMVWDNEDSWTYAIVGAGCQPFDAAAKTGDPAEGRNESRSAEKLGGNPAAQIWAALCANPDFRMRIADLTYRHCFNGGALSELNARKRWLWLAASIRDAIVAESARWGDGGCAVLKPRTRDDDWENAVDAVADHLMVGNATRFTASLRQEGLLPAIAPPELFLSVDELAGTWTLNMSSMEGEIYFRTDGVDPRPAGLAAGQSSEPDEATRYESAVTGTQETRVLARAFADGEWSPLRDVTVRSASPLSALVLADLAYAPPEDADAEYVLLQNTGEVPLELTGCRFAQGIFFTFPDCSLGAGEAVVVTSDPVAFAKVYETLYPVFGPYDGRLSNAGESLALLDPHGRKVIDRTYDTTWPAGGLPLVSRKQSAEKSRASMPVSQGSVGNGIAYILAAAALLGARHRKG